MGRRVREEPGTAEGRGHTRQSPGGNRSSWGALALRNPQVRQMHTQGRLHLLRAHDDSLAPVDVADDGALELGGRTDLGGQIAGRGAGQRGVTGWRRSMWATMGMGRQRVWEGPLGTPRPPRQAAMMPWDTIAAALTSTFMMGSRIVGLARSYPCLHHTAAGVQARSASTHQATATCPTGQGPCCPAPCGHEGLPGWPACPCPQRGVAWDPGPAAATTTAHVGWNPTHPPTQIQTHLKAYMAASLKASSLESTAWALPSVSTTRTPCGRRRRGGHMRQAGELPAPAAPHLLPTALVRSVPSSKRSLCRLRRPSPPTRLLLPRPASAPAPPTYTPPRGAR